MGFEIERRFIVEQIDPDTFSDRHAHKEILQAYVATDPIAAIRIRIVNNEEGIFTIKSGIGVQRVETEAPLDVDVARKMFEVFRFKLAKTRYLRDGWEIDVFHGPLKGLVVAEYERVVEGDVSPAERERVLKEVQAVGLPSFIGKAKEVTDSLTNLHLAQLAYELEHTQYAKAPEINTPKSLKVWQQKSIRDRLLAEQRIPYFVITGAPCSGKTAAIKALRDKGYDKDWHFVPEVATIVIAQVGIKPNSPDPIAQRLFQRTLAQVQRSFEAIANQQAIVDQKQAVVLDRGVLDIAAFVPGLLELENILGTGRQREYAQYTTVLHLELPPKAVYDANKHNNPARSETYEQACELDKRLREAWSGHPHVVNIEYKEVWEDKLDNIVDAIGGTLFGRGL